MKLALLGWDADTEQLLQSLVRRNLVEITRLCRVGTHTATLRTLAPRATLSDDWEELGAGGDWDAIVVARERTASDSTGPVDPAVPADPAEPIKRLTQLGATLLLAHPAVDAITGLELDMIQRDTQARLVIDYPDCRHPALETLRELVESADGSPIGRVEQLVFERTLARRERTTVLEQLARDAETVRAIAGKITRVSATAPTTGEAAWSNVSVQLTGSSGILVRWSIEPGEVERGARISLIGTNGRATLTLPLGADARLDIDDNGAAAAQRTDFARDEVDERRCRALVANLQREPSTQGAAHGTSTSTATSSSAASTPAMSTPSADDAGWLAVCRSLEVADMAEVSLRRGRVMELHHDAVTEEDTFKGMMAAIGCLLLLLVPLVFIAGVAIDGVWRGWHVDLEGASSGSGAASGRTAISSPSKYWLLLVVIPLVFFLVMQSLRAVFPSRSANSQPPSDRSQPGNLS